MNLALALQVAGAVCLVVAGVLVAPWIGLALAGVACLAFGIASERGF